MRIPIEYGQKTEGLKLIRDDGGLLMKVPDITNDIMRLSDTEIKKCFSIMIWDVYEKLPVEVAKISRELLVKCESEKDIEMGLLTAIGLFNITSQIQTGARLNIPENTADIYDFVKSEGFEITMMQDLFNQVDYYRNNGKLQPPEMITVGNINEARGEGRDAVRSVLDAYNVG